MKMCLTCGQEIPAFIEIDGKRRNLQHRKYCLSCSPFGSHNTRVLLGRDMSTEQLCTVCGRVLKNPRRRRCNSCNTLIRRYRAKMAAVEYMGGKCMRCGWKGPVVAYQFHHVDPATKEFTIGEVSNKSWESIRQELGKCELLCANCHQIEHSKRDRAVLIAEAERYNGKLMKWN